MPCRLRLPHDVGGAAVNGLEGCGKMGVILAMTREWLASATCKRSSSESS